MAAMQRGEFAHDQTALEPFAHTWINFRQRTNATTAFIQKAV
jgi:hypothetical protein